MVMTTKSANENWNPFSSISCNVLLIGFYFLMKKYLKTIHLILMDGFQPHVCPWICIL